MIYYTILYYTIGSAHAPPEQGGHHGAEEAAVKNLSPPPDS